VSEVTHELGLAAAQIKESKMATKASDFRTVTRIRDDYTVPPTAL